MIRYVDREIVSQVQKRLGVERVLSYPINVAFRKAQELWKDEMFPFLNVFRTTLWCADTNTRRYSVAATMQSLILDSETKTGVAAVWMPCRATYQVDFCTNYLNQANEVNGKYLWWWRNPYILLSYEGIGFPSPEEGLHGFVSFGEPHNNSALDSLYETGMYFRHTYVFDIVVQMLFTEKGIPVVDRVVSEVQYGEAEKGDKDGG